MKTKKPTPILDRLIASGIIRVSGGELIGMASDGIEVHIGEDYDKDKAEAYLTTHSNPTDW